MQPLLTCKFTALLSQAAPRVAQHSGQTHLRNCINKRYIVNIGKNGFVFAARIKYNLYNV